MKWPLVSVATVAFIAREEANIRNFCRLQLQCKMTNCQ